jgi:hypothetical protein
VQQHVWPDEGARGCRRESTRSGEPGPSNAEAAAEIASQGSSTNGYTLEIARPRRSVPGARQRSVNARSLVYGGHAFVKYRNGGNLPRRSVSSLRTPSGWYASNEPLHGITDPVQRLLLSSYRVPSGADAGGSYVPSSHGVIAQLAEEVAPIANGGAWRPRPHRFTLPRLGRMETLGGDRWGELLFREHGRHFYIFIWFGRLSSSAQVGLLLHALDGMTITAA